MLLTKFQFMYLIIAEINVTKKKWLWTHKHTRYHTQTDNSLPHKEQSIQTATTYTEKFLHVSKLSVSLNKSNCSTIITKSIQIKQ